MLLKYFYHSKLAHASYMVGCQATGEAIIIDPGRNIQPYLAEAEAQEMQIIAAAETHIHADFVSGVRELAEENGAKLYLSNEGDKNWKYQFLDKVNHQLVKDGDAFKIGNILFEVMRTPGHTPEHISFLVTDTAGADKPMGIFSGDFVFAGDVGRPDLLEKAAGIAGTSEAGARQLFGSLQRFKQLPDYMQVWPAHGAGSACGKALGAIPSSTVGYEKLFNAALNYTEDAPFIAALLEGQPEPPKYFAMMKKLNKVGPLLLKTIAPPQKLPVEQLSSLATEGATIIDIRPAKQFADGHIPGTINIPFDGSFITWAGWLLDYETPFYVIAGAAQISEVVQDLAYIGLDNLGGYFEPAALRQWAEQNHLQHYIEVTPQEIAGRVQIGEVLVLDVRDANEWNEGHIPHARHIMLGYLPGRLAALPTDKPILVQCLSGGRSAIGAGLLQAYGFTNVINLKGGIREWAGAGLPIEHH